MTKRTSNSRSSSGSSSRGRSSSPRRTSTRKQKPRESLWQRLTLDQKLDLLGWILFPLALLTILSLVSAQQGVLTEWWISILAQLFGWGMYVVPLFLGAVGLWLILRRFEDRIPTPDPEQIVGVSMGYFVALATLHFIVSTMQPQVNLYSLGEAGLGGGLIGAVLLDLGIKAVGRAGTITTLVMLWLAVITFTAGISPADAVRMLTRRPQATDTPLDISQMTLPPEVMTPTGPKIIGGMSDPEPQKPSRGRKKREEEAPRINTANRASNGEIEFDGLPVKVGTQQWRLPQVADILEEGSEQFYSEDLIRKQSRLIEETLDSLGAPVRIQEINTGPVVTQFGVEPLVIRRFRGTCENGDCKKSINITTQVTTRDAVPGSISCPHCGRRTGIDVKDTRIKVSKIASLADDLALALAARSLRIQAPIPGKRSVGIEVPNSEPSIVSLRDLMESENFDKQKGRLRLGLGQDVSGQAIAYDLRAMPHMLIAGATGAGKSVCVNSIIAALLLQNTPDTLRLLMVDPKRVELTQYNGIPHLLAPVIVDVDRVVPTLRWVMREMDGRYRRFAQVGARNIEDFNQRVAKVDGESTIPYIVVLVDELADLMMQAPEETERVICRLAQMARATGIHLIIATQRPSVDVVTGLIKANFPSRVAFAVASSIDSRVILDTPGAERLLGRGDMLFMPPDVSQPLRLQGAWVSEGELDRLIRFWQQAVEPGARLQQVELAQPFVAPVREERSPQQWEMFPDFEGEAQAAAQFEDTLLPTAVEIFLAENRASVSLLQRRLRIGYTRSARLVDQLTDMGIVMLETEGQFRKINRAVAEALLQSIYPNGDET